MTPRSVTTSIIVGFSYTSFGTAESIRALHKSKGLEDIGCHYVVLNGFKEPDSEYDPASDGRIEFGLPESMIGAHCEGYDETSIGVYLIGDHHRFTARQMVDALPALLSDLVTRYSLSVDRIYSDQDYNPTTTYPQIDTALIRELTLMHRQRNHRLGSGISGS